MLSFGTGATEVCQNEAELCVDVTTTELAVFRGCQFSPKQTDTHIGKKKFIGTAIQIFLYEKLQFLAIQLTLI